MIIHSSLLVHNATHFDAYALNTTPGVNYIYPKNAQAKNLHVQDFTSNRPIPRPTGQ
jgi:hypothetical protein